MIHNPAADVATALALGLVCWLLTKIVVESALLAPPRARVERWALRHRTPVYGALLRAVLTVAGGGNVEETWRSTTRATWRDKIAYLVSCNLCAGTWIGLGLALVAGGVLEVPLIGWVLSGLLYKAVAHLVLSIEHALGRARTGGTTYHLHLDQGMTARPLPSIDLFGSARRERR